jgi:predicted negative regulator of RcsB-dependent stress response
VVIGVVLALVVVGGVAFADYLGDRGQEKASMALGHELRMLERPVSETATTTGEDAPFKTSQEREASIEKSMEEVQAKHGGSRAARTATLVAASAELRQKKYDEALKSYSDFVKEARPEDPLRAVALEGQGYAHEGKGEIDQALASFEQLERENKSDMLVGMGLYHRGRLLVLQNKKEDAAKAFMDVTTAHAGSGAARLAQTRLNELKAQGVKLPEPPAPRAADGGSGGTDAG